MTDEELKNKCSERAKIFQQAMESCHSSSPIDCIEWFADRIAELEKENAELKEKSSRQSKNYKCDVGKLLEENADLKVKVGLSIDCEKAQKNGELCLGYGGDEDEPCEHCKNCIKCECGYYQLGEIEKEDQLTKAKELLKEFVHHYKAKTIYIENMKDLLEQAEQFLSEVEK